jgi:hypothetical protein
MKKISAKVVGLLTISLIIFTCTKNGDAPEMKNSITYNNTQFDIDKGILEYFGIIQGTGNNIDLTLISSGLTPIVTNGKLDSITGTGSGINFEIFTTGSTSLDVGDYTFDETGSGSPGTFDYGNAIFNFNTVTQEGTILDITGGKVTIITKSPVYELSFKCTGSDGKSINGYYKGSLNYYVKSGILRSGKLKKLHKW